jgi:hypothetical protein
MKRLFTLMMAASVMMLASCTAEDAEPIQQQQELPEPNYVDYTILETNIDTLDVMVVREGDTIYDYPSQMIDGKRIIKVLDMDDLVITSNGEVTTPEKPILWMKIKDDLGQLTDPAAFGTPNEDGSYTYGKKMLWQDKIGIAFY